MSSSTTSRSRSRELSGADKGQPPIVSVVIPCYNYGRFLASCVRSVVSQEGVRTRVLVIDDASSDDSTTIAAGLADEHPQVEVLVHEVNRGHIATYNEGLLEWASGDYVTLLSADDELPAGSLARSVRLMEANPGVGMVYGGIEEISDISAPASGSNRRARATVHSGRTWLRRRCREAVNVVPTPGTVLRLGVQQGVGGYDPLLTHAGDFDMWLRVALVSDIGYIGGPPQGRYRIHDSSMSHEVYTEPLADVRQRKLVFDSLFAGHADALTRAGIDAEPTYARLAGHPLWWACRAHEKGQPDATAIEEWLAFARETHPAVESLRPYRALRRRQRLGAAFCHRTQLFVGTAIVRRLANSWWWFRWKRFGG
ncbi:glycosyl transferase family 2 [Homoserinimonas aerilata]|uniref:Glycosyl transferase family 2 n=1 Tax=Homoserinimonas aerilata TaxID=1162970 RepID=A0A542Y1Q2_9MICO|nr:glycosyltransferase family 2 protein [Homoserinimonas aerilata]TQL42008.1 glycosyl transferase family 2 [Homoserinimonas aerilata]